MRKIHKTMVAMLATAIALLCANPVISHAEGTTSIRVSSNAVSVGDTLRVEVTASGSDTISLKYNTDILQFSKCSAECTTEGNAVTFVGTKATMEFTAKSEGKSNLIVSGTSVSGSSTSVQVQGGSGDAAAPQTTADTPTEDVEGQFVVDGIGYVVSDRFTDDEIPAGFERTRVRIDHYDYKALTNGDLTLIYLKPASDTSGKGVFYVYDAEQNTVSAFRMIRCGSGYVLAMTPETLLFEGLKETQIEVEGRQIQAYCIQGQKDFCFVYGKNQNGDAGWYQYDVQENVLQRINDQLVVYAGQSEEDAIAAGTKDVYYDKWKKQRYLLAGMLFLLVVLLVIVLILLIGGRRRETEDDVESGDDVIDDVKANDMKTDDGKEDAPTEDAGKPAKEIDLVYGDIKGTEAFRTKKDTRHKSNSDDQVDILDLNDL